jgi:hypothetical protein
MEVEMFLNLTLCLAEDSTFPVLRYFPLGRPSDTTGLTLRVFQSGSEILEPDEVQGPVEILQDFVALPGVRANRNNGVEFSSFDMCSFLGILVEIFSGSQNLRGLMKQLVCRNKLDCNRYDRCSFGLISAGWR